MTEDEIAAEVTANNRLRAEIGAEIGAELAKKLADVDVALEALFRARWELNGGDFDIEALDDGSGLSRSRLGSIALAPRRDGRLRRRPR